MIPPFWYEGLKYPEHLESDLERFESFEIQRLAKNQRHITKPIAWFSTAEGWRYHVCFDCRHNPQLKRQAISDAETGGHAKPANYWIPPNILQAPPHERRSRT